MSARLSRNREAILSMRELAAAIHYAEDAGWKRVHGLLKRRLQYEIYRYHWTYADDDLDAIAQYVALVDEEMPEPPALLTESGDEPMTPAIDLEHK